MDRTTGELCIELAKVVTDAADDLFILAGRVRELEVRVTKIEEAERFRETLVAMAKNYSDDDCG